MAGRDTLVGILLRADPRAPRIALVLAGALALVALAAWADWATGSVLDCHLAYLPAIAGAGWWAGRWPGIAVALLAAAAWTAVEAATAGADRLHGLPANAATALTFFLLVAHAAATVRRRGRELADLAGRDPLTGLANRRAFHAALRRAVAGGRPLAVALVDLDHFKAINDRWGHASGDLVLCLVARACDETLRAGDLAGRLGGDEFALLLPGADADAAAAVAQRLRARLAELQAGMPVQATLSIGLADRGAAGDADGLLAAADRQLYQAKAAGRDTVAGQPASGPASAS